MAYSSMTITRDDTDIEVDIEYDRSAYGIDADAFVDGQPIALTDAELERAHDIIREQEAEQ